LGTKIFSILYKHALVNFSGEGFEKIAEPIKFFQSKLKNNNENKPENPKIGLASKFALRNLIGALLDLSL
jgi:hypothetical protein